MKGKIKEWLGEYEQEVAAFMDIGIDMTALIMFGMISGSNAIREMCTVGLLLCLCLTIMTCMGFLPYE